MPIAISPPLMFPDQGVRVCTGGDGGGERGKCNWSGEEYLLILLRFSLMDHKTIEVYRQNSGFFANKYLNANNGITKYFSRSFINHSKILDIGCGVGKELNFLLSKGYDAIGIDPCEKLIEIGAEFYPKIKGRVFVDNIPELRSIKQDFDGIICSSVLMHIPSIQLFDVVLSIKEHLKPNGNFLFSIPNNYPIFDLKESRDASGRLYNGVTKNQLILLCERIGFRVIETWDDESVIDNTVVVWQTVLLKFNAGNDTRSLDSIEGIINNDQKVATYKLALFRALAELATTNPKAAKWSHSGVVLLPLDLVIDKWIDYYWKIFESEIFIPQIQNESETYSKPVSFRKLFNQLIIRYRNSGGYEGFNIDRLKLTLTPDHFEPYGSLRAKMKLTIINLINSIKA
jgi:SAM-dependent methyltransferase